MHSRCNVSSEGRVRIHRVLDVYLPVTYYYVVTMRRKESYVSMMVVTVDLDQEPIPLNSKLWCFFFLFSLVLFHAL